MSKANFTFLIIALVLGIAAVFGFFYFRQPASPSEEGSGGTNFISQFNPFSSNGGDKSAATPSDTPSYEPGAPHTLPARLMRVSSMPVAGFTIFTKERLKEVPVVVAPVPSDETGETEAKKPDTKPTPPPVESVPAVRYVDKATGNIYQTFADQIEERKFSSTIIPRVYDAYFGSKAETVVMRYLKTDEKTIETFVGILPKEFLGGDTENNNEVTGSFLPNNVQDISLSPDGSKIFYLFDNGSTSAQNMIGSILTFSNSKKTQIFDSYFTEWLSFWPNSNLITLSTKPSANVPGHLYTMDSAGKNFRKVLSDINGLTTLGSPNGKIILYGDSDLSLSLYDIGARSANRLAVRTLPEKCVWGKGSNVIYCAVPKSIPAGEYPDSWYQGEISFSDQFWKVDVETGNATLILNPAIITQQEIDGIKLFVDEDEKYLFFVNKKDSYLWKLDLE